MSPALPHTGGAYSFARSAMGPWGGFLTGLAENMEYVITPAVVVGAIGLLMQSIVVDLFDVVGDPWWNSEPVWWLVFYAIFVWVNIIGIEATMRFTVVITVLALAILGSSSSRRSSQGSSTPGCGRTSTGRPAGSRRSCRTGSGASSRPYRSRSGSSSRSKSCRSRPRNRWIPRRDVPKGTIWGMHTLLVFSVLTLLINTGVGRRRFLDRGVRRAALRRLQGVFGDGIAASLLALFGVIGLVASFFTIIYAYGRNTYSLSRAGYFPKWLSVTHGERKTPHVALIAGAIVGYVVIARRVVSAASRAAERRSSPRCSTWPCSRR